MPKPSYPATLASTSLTGGIVGCWPLNEGAGTVATDIVGGGVLDCSGPGVSWNASPLGLSTVGAPSRAFLATPAYLKIAINVSMLWVGKVTGTLSAPLGGIAGVAETTPLNDYVLDPFSSKISWGANHLGSSTGAVGLTTPVSGTTYNVLMRVGAPQDGAGAATVSGFINGTFDTNIYTATETTITYGGTSQVFLGTFPGQSDGTSLRHDLLVIWNRLISAAEIAALASDPWQIFAAAAPTRSSAFLMSC